MKAVFTMIVFLVLATALVAMVAASRSEEKAFQQEVENSIRKKELFYAARDSESLFWQSANAGLRDWVNGCLLLGACRDDHLSIKVEQRLSTWKNYVEGQAVDFSLTVLEGDYGKPDEAAGPTFGVVETRVRVLGKAGLFAEEILEKFTKLKVYKPTVRIRDSGGDNAVLVRVSDSDYTTYGIVGKGEQVECFLIVLEGKEDPRLHLASLAANYIILPAITESLGLNYCIGS